jgi:hypothetical protein
MASNSMVAPSTMNKPPSNNTPTSSPKAAMWATGARRWLATTTPITVVANRPASTLNTLAATKVPMTNARVSGLCNRSGTRLRRKRRARAKPPAKPATVPNPALLATTVAACHPPSASTMLSNTAAANTAPMGSITMHSQRKIGATGSRSRTDCSKGSTTVGPDTTKMAPNKNPAEAGTSNSITAAAPPTSQVTPRPTVTRPATGRPTVRTLASSRPRPPSNKMSPTAMEITGASASPKSTSGFTAPVTGPASTPIGSRNSTDGRLNHDATHCAPTPAATIAAMAMARSLCMRSILPALALLQPDARSTDGPW